MSAGVSSPSAPRADGPAGLARLLELETIARLEVAQDLVRPRDHLLAVLELAARQDLDVGLARDPGLDAPPLGPVEDLDEHARDLLLLARGRILLVLGRG